MINPSDLYKGLSALGIDFYTGVPDSLLKNFCFYIDDNVPKGNHIIAANEGNAIAIAAGYHMASSRIPCVYMQNSGLGNSINPLVSLVDPEVYKIPMLLIVGWRGESGVKDEPQHIKQGKITQGQLKLLDIPYRILDDNTDVAKTLNELFEVMMEKQVSVALLVRKNTFKSYPASNKKAGNEVYMLRERALDLLLDCTEISDLFVSTTGKTSRELFELRSKRREEQNDFLSIGSMGHASSIALGIALAQPKRRVICLDGDGALLMHMGAMPVIGNQKPSNLIHVVLNNGCHESVGGQSTVAQSIDFSSIALGCGYNGYYKVNNDNDIKRAWKDIADREGPFLVEILLRPGSRDDLGRPISTPEMNKKVFMNNILGK